MKSEPNSSYRLDFNLITVGPLKSNSFSLLCGDFSIAWKLLRSNLRLSLILCAKVLIQEIASWDKHERMSIKSNCFKLNLTEIERERDWCLYFIWSAIWRLRCTLIIPIPESFAFLPRHLFDRVSIEILWYQRRGRI